MNYTGYIVWLNSINGFFKFLEDSEEIIVDRDNLSPIRLELHQAVFFLAYDIYRYWELYDSKEDEEFYDEAYIKDYLINHKVPYFDMKLPNSSSFLPWFENFDRVMKNIDDDLTSGLERGEGYSFHFWENKPAPWRPGGVSYDKLQETGDFFWFLVCVIQRFGSLVRYNPEAVSKLLLKFIKQRPNDLNLDIFKPLESFAFRNKLIAQYGKITLKSLKEEVDLEKLDFSKLVPLDIQKTPEYELFSSYHNNGNYYAEDDIIQLAITASGAMAQSLERQDLEPKILTKYQLKKKAKREIKSES